MALNLAIKFEVRFGSGSDSNGGGFKAGASGTDYSLQDAAQYALTGLTTAAANAIILTASAAAVMVGNLINITGGTNFTTGIYEITSVSVGVSITVDRNCSSAAGAAGTANVGGALATIGGLGTITMVTGQVAWLKNGTNTLSTSSVNVSGGVYTGTANVGVPIIGYNATRGDLNNVIGSANRPVIDCGAITTITVFGQSNRTYIANVKIDGKGNSSVTGFSTTTYNCTAANCTIGFSGSSVNSFILSSALVCGTGFSSTPLMIGSFSNDCTTTGFGGDRLVNCVSINDAVAATPNTANQPMVLWNCTFHEAAGDGVTGLVLSSIIGNCVFTSNASDAIDFSNATTAPTTFLGVNNAFYNNGTVYETAPPTTQTSGSITVTSDPYVSEVADDLAPNNTSGAGALLRNVGVKIIGQTTDNHDVGAPHHADPTTTGGGIFF